MGCAHTLSFAGCSCFPARSTTSGSHNWAILPPVLTMPAHSQPPSAVPFVLLCLNFAACILLVPRAAAHVIDRWRPSHLPDAHTAPLICLTDLLLPPLSGRCAPLSSAFADIDSLISPYHSSPHACTNMHHALTMYMLHFTGSATDAFAEHLSTER